MQKPVLSRGGLAATAGVRDGASAAAALLVEAAALGIGLAALPAAPRTARHADGRFRGHQPSRLAPGLAESGGQAVRRTGRWTDPAARPCVPGSSRMSAGVPTRPPA
jgi:hypothetical protein